jgi:hypothetical protein
MWRPRAGRDRDGGWRRRLVKGVGGVRLCAGRGEMREVRGQPAAQRRRLIIIKIIYYYYRYCYCERRKDDAS